ncbi:hypothetical protein [Chromohalobacter israelensis]|uniref:hypothetical protein n=1 Tax=Chromohalobacter israelensis TaxID=141390 RepID=UPI0011B2631B|nr:hypothetical protein [Chromohalobacter salexigens]
MTKEELYSNKEIIDDTDLIYELSKYYRDLNPDDAPKFNKPQYQIIKHLVSRISYENVVLISIADLCYILGTTTDNVSKRIKTGGNLIEYYSYRTDRTLDFGRAKILINPNYGWKPSYTKSRQDAVTEWYMTRDMAEASKTDFSISHAYTMLKQLKKDY